MELCYQTIQAHDFWHLHQNHNCVLQVLVLWLCGPDQLMLSAQVGGSDQWGNIVAGVDLIRRRSSSTVTPACTHSTILGTLRHLLARTAQFLGHCDTCLHTQHNAWDTATPACTHSTILGALRHLLARTAQFLGHCDICLHTQHNSWDTATSACTPSAIKPSTLYVARHILCAKCVCMQAFGLTVPLVTTAAGQKLGKSSGNAVWWLHTPCGAPCSLIGCGQAGW
jgi:hypothetical protein